MLWELAQPQVQSGGDYRSSSTHRGASDVPAAGWGEPTLIRPRLGQGAFRIIVTDNYARRCAVTGERTLPALDAAHIRPYAEHGEHEPSNGLLLRRDIHSLFDRGYVTVTPAGHFEVSRRIRDEFENGRDYYALHGKAIRVPDIGELQPDLNALRPKYVFWPKCGSTLTCEGDRPSVETLFRVGSFRDTARFRPARHGFPEERLAS